MKVDPLKIKVSEFWSVRGCPLGAALRKKMKRAKTLPAKKFLCVYDDEVLPNRGHCQSCGTEKCMCPKAQNGPGDPDLLNHEWCSSKAQINGTTVHVTAIFGMTLSGLVIDDIYHRVLRASAAAETNIEPKDLNMPERAMENVSEAPVNTAEASKGKTTSKMPEA